MHLGQQPSEPATPTRAASSAHRSSLGTTNAEDAELALGATSNAMRRLASIATQIARTDATVLITGESGVGKERLARFIHDASPRAGGPFVAVNCGALPDTLFESELFGHARGAFTGALTERTGLFEAAHRGTLLLDEVGEISLPMQVKLLRALQERHVRRVGENRERRFDGRIIAATNRNLQADVADGRFRRDLLYRVKVVELHIPPLRERAEDLRSLAHAILESTAREMRRDIVGFTEQALEWILQYSWPGNVRELENAIARACALAPGEHVDVTDLPDEIRAASLFVPAGEPVRPLRDIEREYILAVLAKNQGNKSRTAERLGIASATLFRKLKRYARG